MYSMLCECFRVAPQLHHTAKCCFCGQITSNWCICQSPVPCAGDTPILPNKLCGKQIPSLVTFHVIITKLNVVNVVQHSQLFQV